MRSAPKAAFALSLIVLLCLNSVPATAAQPGAYPNKPIRFLVAQTPGSSIDAISRVVATRMGELLGQQFVVDILEKLNATLVSAVRDPATVEALKRIGAEPLIGSPADFTKLIAKEWKNLGDAIRVSNLKVD